MLQGGDIDHFKAALDQGCPPDTPLDDENWTALHSVVDPTRTPTLTVAQRVDFVRLLVSHGADTNIRNHAEFTPLHFATAYGLPLPVVEALVAAGADVNAQTYDGSTPLEFAVVASHAEIVKCLLDHGANPNSHAGNSIEEKGMTALHLAARGQPHARNHSTVYLSTPDQADIIKMLLAKGADKSVRDARGRTALDLAQQNQQQSAVGLLQN